MSGSNTGTVTTWDEGEGLGQVTEDGTGKVRPFARASCSADLRSALQNNGTSHLRVTFDVAANGDAINLGLA